MTTTTITYDDKSVRRFMTASIVWALVAMLVGVIIASQLSWWQMNGKFLEALTFGAFKGEGLKYITFGRLRPLHTNAAIFAFVGNMMFAGIYYSLQRLCKARMASDLLSAIHFWGWQLIIVAAALTLPAGLTRSKEYAELIWPINIAVAVIWVVFAINFFWTIAKRNEPSLYVAIWFYIATIITVAILYIVNHLSIPTSWTHSYTIFGGFRDGLVQWWYGHNAVAFFLTTPILGIMYYFLPKAANRPVYSYRLSIVHFWSLVFIYIWAGPHHLLNTALPKWLQMLGTLFSLMLWAPSWGGMLNGLLTLRGGWAQLRTDPVIKFFAAGVTFYGMATFEGPLLAISKVNELSHYTDWTIGHVHSGTLGWNGLMAAGMFYWLAPRLWNTKLWSKNLANMHFWIALTGILLYIAAMWVAGITQGLMLGQTSASGATLKYEFVETLKAIHWPYFLRTFGGFLYLFGFLLMAFNIWKTARSGKAVESTAEVVVIDRHRKDDMSVIAVFFSDPLAYIVLGFAFVILGFFLPPYANLAAFIGAAGIAAKAVSTFRNSGGSWTNWHERLLENYMPFSLLVFGAVVIGGMVQIIPSLLVSGNNNLQGRLQVLYTPLELAGRDIYVSEGCYLCHSQMIRTLKPDVMRYGRPGRIDDYSHLGESIYDHPFQWGSKRIGPDLAREGGEPVKGCKYMRSGKRPNDWHFNHFLNPRAVSPDSIMPVYSFLLDDKVDIDALPAKIRVQRQLGIPYDPMTDDVIRDKAIFQATEIADSLKGKAYVPSLSEDQLRAKLIDSKLVALIAYVQKLGAYQEVTNEKATEPDPLNPDSERATLIHNPPAAPASK